MKRLLGTSPDSRRVQPAAAQEHRDTHIDQARVQPPRRVIPEADFERVLVC